MYNKLTKLAEEAMRIEADLPKRLDYTKGDHPTIDDFDIYTFEQIWASTALGFGGIGGSAITSARTFVFIPASCDQNCFVYFGGCFAYQVPYSEKFMKDVLNNEMEPVSKAGKYLIGERHQG